MRTLNNHFISNLCTMYPPFFLLSKLRSFGEKKREGTQCISWIWSDYLMFSLTILQNFSDAWVAALIITLCLFPKNIVLYPLIVHCPWCVALVLITTLLNFHESLLVLFCFWVVCLWFCLNTSGRPPICSCCTENWLVRS